MPHKRARLYDACALLTAIVVIIVDQWTKALVVKNMPIGSEQPFPILGHYFYLWHIHNTGAAFGMLAGGNGSLVLAVLILAAVAVVGYLYARMVNSGPLNYKLIFGLIIGGAFGNLFDRVQHSGYVVDFISFQIPELNYKFAIFNVADACISVGVILLFLFVLFSGMPQEKRGQQQSETGGRRGDGAPSSAGETDVHGAPLHTAEQDVQK